MSIEVDVWLRGDESASTKLIEGISREPGEWTDEDVRLLLEGMLLAMHRLKYPDDDGRTVALRGISWIVNPYDDGGVLIAIEITMGAAIAGPFDIEQAVLESMISRVLEQPLPPPSHAVH